MQCCRLLERHLMRFKLILPDPKFSPPPTVLHSINWALSPPLHSSSAATSSTGKMHVNACESRWAKPYLFCCSLSHCFLIYLMCVTRLCLFLNSHLFNWLIETFSCECTETILHIGCYWAFVAFIVAPFELPFGVSHLFTDRLCFLFSFCLFLHLL